jgi:uncharacterized protein YecE (DUF72 family)
VDVLYPRKASSLERLDAYAQVFRTVEVNNTFYGWPKDEIFARWRDRVPEGFIITAKAARELTHKRRLNDPEPWVEQMASGMSRLEEKRGVLLFQLPPYFRCALDRLDRLLSVVPQGQRVSVEFRHPSWQTEETFAILSRHGAAYCITSGANLPCVLRATAGFVYVRLHGTDPHEIHLGLYADADLHWWAGRISEWTAQDRDVYAYFNNDEQGYAVQNASWLKDLVGA